MLPFVLDRDGKSVRNDGAERTARNAAARSVISYRPEPPLVPSDTPARRQRFGQYLAVSLVCAFGAAQFYGADPRPWGSAAAWAVITALLVGPLAWLARDRLPPDRYETLAYVAAGAAILVAIVWLGVALAFAPRLFPYGPGFAAGMAFGTLAVLFAERTVVPDRMCDAGL
jgi:apolipoprotein N-acyltransferase